MSRRIARLGPGEFFGGVVRRLQLDGLLLTETRHLSHQVIPAHEHEPAHFCLGLSGGCVERIGQREITCAPGTTEFHPASTRHASRWGATGGRCFTLTLGDAYTRRLAEEDLAGPRPGVLGAQARDLMWRLHRELVASDDCSPLVVEGLALTLLGTATRRHARARGVPSWLPRAEEYLHANYMKQVRVGAVAAAVGVPPLHLGRWFRRVHGQTIGEWVRMLRVDHAAHLLATTTHSISEVAQLAGFVDHAHLARTFRRARQLTPSQFRSLVAGE